MGNSTLFNRNFAPWTIESVSYFIEYHKEKSVVGQVREALYNPVILYFSAVEKNKTVVLVK